jgi:hypothetical protein
MHACADTRLNVIEHYEDGLLSYPGAHPESSGQSPKWTKEEETAVRRKLDRVIVPLTTFLYLLCFLDRYTMSPHRVRHSLTVNAESMLGMLESKAWQKS